MTQSNLFCENCGNKMSPDQEYCSSCGAQQPENKGKFSTIGGFNAPNQQPLAAQEITPWEGGSLLETSKDFVLNPYETGKRVLPASQSPNPVVLVVIAGLLAGLVAQFEANNTVYAFTSEVDDLTKQQILGSSQGPALNIGAPLVGALLSWFIGSWLLGAFVKGGFPMNSPLRFNASESMRKLNAYRFVPTIIASIIQLVVLLTVGSEQTITYGIDLIPFFNIEGPTIVSISGFGMVYSLSQYLITPIFYAYSLYMMWKAIVANQYTGAGLYVILIILGYFSVIAPILAFF